MDIGPLITTSIVAVGPEHSLAETARRMTERHVGSAVVMTEDGRPGIITERDLLRAIAEGADPSSATVADYMTAGAMTASPSLQAVEAARRMLEGRFRHLVVVDEGGRVAGVLSIRDLVAALLDEFDPGNRSR
jgi:CBS domain-containing protein